jgi:hypothetical protein
MATYKAFRYPRGNFLSSGKVVVKVDDAYLPPCNEIYNHSPDGFEWGYGGSGPAQLALAIMVHHFKGDTKKALSYYQEFKWMVIAQITMTRWELTSEEVDGFIAAIDAERRHLQPQEASHERPDDRNEPGGGKAEGGGVSEGGA